MLLQYTFYDGPPFATGLPHYGHILAGTIKDIVTRLVAAIVLYLTLTTCSSPQWQCFCCRID